MEKGNRFGGCTSSASPGMSTLQMQVIFGEEELSQGIVAIKNLELKTQENVKEEELVEELKRRLSTQ
jgi:histidyl-tRNA synthetase